LDAAGLTALPGASIPVPRIAEAAASLECRHYQTLVVGPERRLCVGEVVYLHARAGIVDPARMYVNLDVYKPVARLFANLYAPLGKPFTLVRQTYAEWLASRARLLFFNRHLALATSRRKIHRGWRCFRIAGAAEKCKAGRISIDAWRRL